MTEDSRPVICDFGISVQTSHSDSDGGTLSTGSTRDRTTGVLVRGFQLASRLL